jgi:hypothetical protein
VAEFLLAAPLSVMAVAARKKELARERKKVVDKRKHEFNWFFRSNMNLNTCSCLDLHPF